MIHSVILVPSLWRVFPITPSSQTDMPSLTIVTLDKEHAFKEKKTVHTKSFSSSSSSFLDITPALQEYLSSPLSFNHHYPHIHIHSLSHKDETHFTSTSTTNTNTTTTSPIEDPTSGEKDTPQPAGRARSRNCPLHTQMTPNADYLRISTPSKTHASQKAVLQTKSSHSRFSPP